jgi:hypothetical protein
MKIHSKKIAIVEKREQARNIIYVPCLFYRNKGRANVA